MFNPINLIPAPIRMYALTGAIVASFTAGLWVRGYVCMAENNAISVKENKEIIDSGVKGNDKLSEVEKRNAKLREEVRRTAAMLAKNRGINGERINCVVSPDGVRGINAIRRASDTSIHK